MRKIFIVIMLFVLAGCSTKTSQSPAIAESVKPPAPATSEYGRIYNFYSDFDVVNGILGLKPDLYNLTMAAVHHILDFDWGPNPETYLELIDDIKLYYVKPGWWYFDVGHGGGNYTILIYNKSGEIIYKEFDREVQIEEQEYIDAATHWDNMGDLEEIVGVSKDKNTHIRIEYYHAQNDVSMLDPVRFSKRAVITIRHEGRYWRLTNVIITNSGAGDTTFQAFINNPEANEAEEVFNMMWQHEGWYLVGNFDIPAKDNGDTPLIEPGPQFEYGQFPSHLVGYKPYHKMFRRDGTVTMFK